MFWEDAIDQAKENLGIVGYTSDWAEVVEEAKEIMSEENSAIAKEAHWVYLNSNEWKLKRLKILKRDESLCQDCLKYIPETKKTFDKFDLTAIDFFIHAEQVYHLDYNYKQTEFEEEYCISVCIVCHNIRHCERRADAERLIQNRKDNLLGKVYHQLLKQPKHIEEANRQQKAFIDSLVINPGDFDKEKKEMVDLRINEVENDQGNN